MAVAVLDILGFEHMMERRETQDIVSAIHKCLGTVDDSRSVVLHDFDHFVGLSGGRRPQIELLNFSDTLVLCLTCTESVPLLLRTPGQMVVSISYAVSMIISQAAISGIPLRGAIAFGHGYVSHRPLLFVGRPFLEAIHLEKVQQWAGAALTVSAENALLELELERRQFVVQYSVPIKNGSELRPHYAVNWTRPFVPVNISPPPWEEMFSQASPDVQVKRRETEKFFNKYLRR